MSWSPSHAASQSSLRPAQFPPAVPPGATPLSPPPSSVQFGHSAANLAQHGSAAGTRPRNPPKKKKKVSSRPIELKQSQLQEGPKTQDAVLRYRPPSTGPEASRSPLKGSRNTPEEVSSLRDRQNQESTSRNAHPSRGAPLSPSTRTGQPSFRRELSNHVNSADTDRNGKTKVGQIGQTEQFPSHGRAQVNGSKELTRTAVGVQSGMAAGLRTSPERPDEDTTAKLGPASSDLANGHQPPESLATPEVGSSHRGRPKGSKNNAIYPLSNHLDRPRPRRVEARPDYRIRRIRERRTDLPPKPPSPSPRDLYDSIQPQFLQFKCEWNDCKAILNNVATLRKHVGTVHGWEARDTLCCGWGKCGKDDSTGVLSVFGSIEKLDEHFQTRHLESVRWHLGDGRHGRGLVLKEAVMGDTSYLFRNGIQVTPSVKNQRTETLVEMRARKHRLKEILLKTALDDSGDPVDLEDDQDTGDSSL